jgi:regulator of replication initiation timing
MIDAKKKQTMDCPILEENRRLEAENKRLNNRIAEIVDTLKAKLSEPKFKNFKNGEQNEKK